jgi:DNA-binding winged helix-turn-helix (wHTH) protein
MPGVSIQSPRDAVDWGPAVARWCGSMKVFPPFRLDSMNQCLWRLADRGRDERILLTPKAFAVLAYRVEHAGRLVTHDELLEAVWPRSVVEPQAVKKHVLAVRSALGDYPKNSLFIETVTKRGYRFIAPVSESLASSPSVSGRRTQGTLVGRSTALEELHEAWQRALSAERQIVFITGEPGLSFATAERTWHGLAWEANARVALANQDRTRARECIGEAVSAVEGFDVPLATWRVHATAAHIEEESGNSDAARSHREVSRRTILRLANSLPEEEPLREMFLSAPAVVQAQQGFVAATRVEGRL